jgi:hypothetical protein
MSSKRRPVIKRRTMRLPHPATTVGDETHRPLDDGRWWDQAGEEAVAAARDETTMVFAEHGARNMRDSLAVGLYENEPPYWLGAALPNSPLLVQTSSTVDAFTKARANLLRRCIGTAASMLVKQPTEIRCVTNGAAWKLKKRAKERQKFVNGMLRETGFHEIRKCTFVDGCLTRSGGLPLFAIDWQNKRIVCRRLHPSHVAWNGYEGGEPSNLYLRYPEQCSVLVDQYPDKAEEIKKATRTTRTVDQSYRQTIGNESLADLIEVTETFHLSADRAKPGRHIKCVEGVTLIDEEWALPCFPIPRFCWERADYGWDNRPVFDDLVGYHVEIGKAMRKIAKAQSLACVPRVGIEVGSELVEDELTNEIGGFFHFRGTPPVFGTQQALPAEFYRYLDWLFAQAMADIGINEMQSQAQIPRGFEGASGVALRELNDTGSTRQILHGHAIEQQTIEAGEICFQLAAKLAEKDDAFAVNALGTKSYERISWKDVSGDLDDIRFVCTPASALPSGTTAKIQTVTEIIKGGLLPPEEVQGGLGLQLLNFPDFERVVTMETASRELVEMQVDGALYDGEWFAPEPYQSQTGLQLLKTMAYRAYAQALQMDGVPARNLDLLRRLMSEADTLTQTLAGRAPQIQQPLAAVPPPAPAPLEQSPLAPPPMPAVGGGVV